MSIVNLSSCINDIVKDETHVSIPEHVDIMISGGGLGIYYALGGLSYMNELICKNKLVIHKISGASAGAIAAVFFVSCMEHKPDSSKEWHGQYNRIREKVQNEKLGLWDAIKSDLLDILPDDAWEKCHKRVYISSLKWNVKGWKTEYFNTYTCNQDLIDALSASCNIPYCTTNQLFVDINGKKFTDGAKPYDFNPYHRRHVVYVDLFWLDYSYRKRLSLCDAYIDTIVLKGILDMFNYCVNNIEVNSLYTNKYNERKGLYDSIKKKASRATKMASLIIG